MDFNRYPLVIWSLLTSLADIYASVNMSRFPTVKNTSQSSSYDSNATSDRVVDGCTKQRYSDGCCSHTALGKKEAWWQIDLKGLVVMEHVNIYYRNESDQQRQRFGGYQLYQSNMSEWRNSYLCFQDNTTTMEQMSFTPMIPCNGSARYLTIYSDRRPEAMRLTWYSYNAFLELCEVEVYGCPLGTYGNGNCDSECDAGCANGLCNPNTGECEYCAERYYRAGSSCIACPSNCYDGLCNVESGDCFTCTSGYYGNHCNETCQFHCKDNRCMQSNGECNECDDTFYGPFCDDCSLGCTHQVCNKTSGMCSTCKPGYFGYTCNVNCSSYCKDGICNQTSGVCAECELGRFGIECNQTCPAHCNDSHCDRYGGECTDCDDKFYGPFCKACSGGCNDPVCNKTSGSCSPCKPGYFGNTCNVNCSSNCKEGICNQTSGVCAECELGLFGIECNQTCPAHCKDSQCDRYSGECTACTSGYFGLECEEECGQCSAVSCSRSDGLCLCSNMTQGTCGCKPGWEGKNCTTKKIMQVADSASQTGMQVGVSVGVVAVIGIVITAVVIFVRRKRLSQHNDNQRGCNNKMFENDESLSVPFKTSNKQPNRGDTTSGDKRVYQNVHDMDININDDVVYSNVENNGVYFHELSSIIDNKSRNKAAAFQEEFQAFPWGAIHPHEAGKKTSNTPKNRFKTIFPYDHSRIVLDIIGSDIDTNYINANYIDGMENKKEYIASQGPKQNTLDDFWRMAWQVNSGKIVMLTNIMEGRNVKCHKYWPDEEEPIVTQTFEVRLYGERTYAFYVIRDISIILKKTKEQRHVHQFHFTTWPDHGIPDTLELVLFNRRVMSYSTELTGQMIVHCSAGIGRTGTFIGLNALLTHGRKTGKVDIPKYRKIMRNGRMNMIQTYEQYIALHELLLEGFKLQDSLIYRHTFPAALATMSPKDKPANQTKIHLEFEGLVMLTPNYSSECFKAALLQENIGKNRNKDILAVDKFRPILQSQLPNRTDYINAVMIQSYTSKSGYLMTQFPLEDTIDDFWTMVLDYSCDNIVVLGQPSENEDCLREEGRDSVISVRKLQDRSSNTELSIAEYEIVNESSSIEKIIRIFSMPQWSSDTLLPSSDTCLLQLLEHLDSRRRQDNTRPVVVMCQDGCTQSGLFCCISNIRDQMKMDDEVDIFQTARQLKKRRPEAIENIKQYQYCYNILGQYLDSTNIYVN